MYKASDIVIYNQHATTILLIYLSTLQSKTFPYLNLFDK